MNIVALFLSPHGRLGRLGYLLGVVSLTVIQGITLGMTHALGVNTKSLLVISFSLAFGVLGWILAIKRAHDLGNSGWWLAGWVLVPLFGGFALMAASGVLAAGSQNVTALLLTFASLALFLVSLWHSLVKMLFFKGNGGPNAFGPPGDFMRKFLDVDEAPIFEAVATSVARQSSAAASAPRTAARPARTLTPHAAGKPAGFGRRNLNPA